MYSELFATDEFSKVKAEALNLSMDVKKHFENQFENFIKDTQNFSLNKNFPDINIALFLKEEGSIGRFLKKKITKKINKILKKRISK
jgi:hypothetical protein